MFKIYLFFCCVIASLSFGARAQDVELEELSRIKPMVSTTTDVKEVYGSGEDKEDATWYYFKGHSVKITYSDGTCTEGWRVRKNTVVQASVFFFDGKDLAKLKQRVNYTRFKEIRSPDNMGEKHYYDDLNGFQYVINDQENLWYSFTLYPGKKYSKFRCRD